jgi:hypothetical protein
VRRVCVCQLMVMTDPRYISLEEVAAGWTVKGLLKAIADRPNDQRFSALIGTPTLKLPDFRWHRHATER